MARNLISACAAFILAIALGGCANQNSIFRKNVAAASTNPVVFTVDAKQRHLIVAPNRFEGKGWAVCAEAAPDVFSALSTSAAADLGFGHSGTQTDAQAKAALAIAEAAGTIERTQTINLLRESMYRTCERYLSGAIDRSSFAVQAGRDWRAMIGILAIEQLTRAARPPSTIIAAGSTSASVQSESDAIRQLIIAQGAEEAARTAKKSADDDLASTCGTITPDNEAACKPKQAAAASAKDALDRATHKRETWEAITKSYNQSLTSSASTGTVTNNAGGYQAPATTPTDMTKVAETVGDIVKWAFGTDETQLFCIQAMQNQMDPKLTDTCLTYLVTKVKAEQSLFAIPTVQSRARILGTAMDTVRPKAVEFLSSLDEKTYASERALIASDVGSFCEGQTRDACINEVRNNPDFDMIAEQLSKAIDQRIQARGHP